MADKYVCTLTPELKEKAREELKEKEEWRSRDVQALRDMIIKNKAIKCPLDDGFLLRFLRVKKFDYDRAYTTLENYYKIRAENPDHFKNLKPSNSMACIDAGVTQVLPSKDKQGRRILYFRPGKWDPSKYNVFELLKVNMMNLECIIRSEETQVNGIVMLGNMEGIGMEQAKNLNREYFRLTSSLMQEAFPLRMKAMHAVNEPSIFGTIFALVKPFLSEKFVSRDAFPLRLKAFHIVNEPSIFSYIFSIVKPFLKQKLTSRMQFHGPYPESLLKEFDKESLPEELGGTLPNGDKLAMEWKKELLSNEKMLEDMLQYKIELDRNISGGAVKTTDTPVDCLTGTYKKLNID